MAKSDFLRKLNDAIANPRPNSLLYNRIVLYFVFFVAVVNLYTLAVGNHSSFAAVFVLVGFLTSFFSKNMVVILVIAIVITNLLKSALTPNSFEGFDSDEKKANKDSTKGSKDQLDTESTEDSKKDSTKDSTKDSKKGSKTATEVKQDIVTDGQALLKLQEQIVDGFQEIDPYMKEAEVLTKKIQQSAETFESLQRK